MQAVTANAMRTSARCSGVFDYPRRNRRNRRELRELRERGVLLAYLLRNLAITRPNQVWALDTTYIPMARGFVYLTAVVDVASRRVLTHKVAITLEACHAKETLLCLTNADLFLSNFALLPKNDSLIRQEIFPVNFQAQYWPARLQAPPGLALRKFGAEISAGIFHFSLLISLLAGKST